MADNFAVHLGGGLYLDARGNLVYGPQTGLQVYEAPGGFRLDTKKIEETFKDLSDLLPRDEAAQKKWIDWGVPKEIVGSLSKLAGIAGIVATTISVYAWALGVLIAVMELMSGDEGMSPQMAQALYSIKNQLHGMEEIQRAEQMIAIHSEWDGRVNTMNGLLTRLVVEQPVGAARAQIVEQMRTLVDELDVPLSNLRNREWDVTFDPDGHKARGFASELLVFEKSDGTLPAVPMVPATVTTFDYRLGVPMLLYGAATYTALLQVAMPWFRSAGMYADHLRKTAEAIDRFVIRMQDECLARTEYDAQTVLQQQGWKIHDILDPASGGPRSMPYTPWLDYAVGAFDLVRYDDAFMAERFGAEFQAGVDWKKRGLFDYGWTTTETLLDEIATAANEQAHQDYANLQAASGMLRLITTAAWLRFLTTPPGQSQTVSGVAQDTRRFLDEAPTTATSPPIFPVGVISHSATLRRYNARGRARVTTQGPGYVPQFHYRVVLRTIDSDFGNGGWDSQGYVGYVWEADHEPTAGDPRCKRLRTVMRQGAVLSEVVLYEGTAPSQTVTRSGSKNLRATTFDWYVPVVTPWSKLGPPSSVAAVRAAAARDGSPGAESRIGSGGVSIHLIDDGDVPMQTLGAPGPLAFTSVGDIWLESGVSALSDVSLEKAERRHAKVEDVKLDWELTWTEDKLDVSISGDPVNRPFQVHVVVEETVYSGEIPPPNLTDVLSDDQLREHIHTPFVVEVVNQVVLVPEEFFVEERKAIEAGSKLYHDFIRRFSEVAPVGPGDPVESLEAAIRDRLTRSPSTSTLADALDRRVEFARDQASDVWQAVIRESDVTVSREQPEKVRK